MHLHYCSLALCEQLLLLSHQQNCWILIGWNGVTDHQYKWLFLTSQQLLGMLRLLTTY